MTDDSSTTGPSPDTTAFQHATVTDIASRRRSDDVLCSMTFVFGGVNYGTVPIAKPYTKGKPIVLYVVSQSGDDLETGGPIECLVTDDVTLAAGANVAR